MRDFLSRLVSGFTSEDDRSHLDLVADHIQRALLVVSPPSIPGLDIGVFAEPARLVGGDYVDLIAPAARSLVFGLGDASGKSMAAALNAMMLRYLIRGLVRAHGMSSLELIVTHANSVVTDEKNDGEFITFLLGCVNLDSGTLSVVNAGHEPPLILRPAASVVVVMNLHDIVLGITYETNYVRENVQFEAGDTAVFYTDGLTEATDEQGELFTNGASEGSDAGISTTSGARNCRGDIFADQDFLECSIARRCDHPRPAPNGGSAAPSWRYRQLTKVTIATRVSDEVVPIRGRQKRCAKGPLARNRTGCRRTNRHRVPSPRLSTTDTVSGMASRSVWHVGPGEVT